MKYVSQRRLHSAANVARLTEQEPGIAMTDPILFPYIDTAMRVIALLALCAVPVLIPLPPRLRLAVRNIAARNRLKRHPARVPSAGASQ